MTGNYDGIAGIDVDLNIQPMREVGDSGLRRYSGYVRDEFLRDLVGINGVRVYREMRDNDPVVGAIMLATENLLKGVEWKAVPGNDTPDGRAGAEFLHQCLHDMEEPLSSVIANALTCLTYGWSLSELVYKKRMGPETKKPEFWSRYTDGLIGWRKMAFRSQDTLYRWEFTYNGEIVGFYQLPLTNPTLRWLPWEKFLLFRTTTDKGNPEGRSVLRNAYTSYFYKKRIEAIEAIGVERDLAGLPYMRVPLDIMLSTATTAQKALFNNLKTIIQNLRRDQNEGVILPSTRDASGHPLYELSLLSTGGRRQLDTDGIVRRYDQRIAMTMLADFILLGHEKVGSFALSSDKTDLFAVSLGAILTMIKEVFNREAIPRLWKLNGLPLDTLPQLDHGDIEREDIAKLATFIKDMGAGGFITPGDEATEAHLRRMANLPQLGEKELVIGDDTDADESDEPDAEDADPADGGADA
jgi:hypothetical protein